MQVVTLVISSEVRMLAAHWTETEGLVLGRFQELAGLGQRTVVTATPLWGGSERAGGTSSLQAVWGLYTASSLIGCWLSEKEMVISSSRSSPDWRQKSESSSSRPRLRRNSCTHTHCHRARCGAEPRVGPAHLQADVENRHGQVQASRDHLLVLQQHLLGAQTCRGAHQLIVTVTPSGALRDPPPAHAPT